MGFDFDLNLFHKAPFLLNFYSTLEDELDQLLRFCMKKKEIVKFEEETFVKRNSAQ